MINNTSKNEQQEDGHGPCVVGIDISKYHLDTCMLPSGRTEQFPNTKSGVRAFSAWVCPCVERVVYESTGSYHLLLEDLLADKLPLSRINPQRGKRFAEALGTMAKTDRSDARMLAKMGQVLKQDIRQLPVRSRQDQDLDELRTARNAVTKGLTVLKGRLEHTRHALVKREIKKAIRRDELQIKRLDKEIDRLVSANEEMSRKVELLETIPGIARLTAIGLLVEMPELGTLSTRQASSLLGLAPMANDSGAMHGKRYIRGGRKRARSLLYMPALAAIRWNPVMREHHLLFKQKGKPGKVAVTAAMRKLAIVANAVVRDGKTWDQKHKSIPDQAAA